MATTYLSRTMEAATNRKICTYSAWVKKSSLSGNQMLFSGGDTSARYGFIDFNSNNALFTQSATSDSTDWSLTSSNLYRDPAAWYHVCVTYDSTESVAEDRVKMYVNGEQITSFSAESYPTLNYDFQWTYTGDTQMVGRLSLYGYWDGVMAHVHYIDGTAYAPTAFAETDSTSGIWIAKTSPSLTYGNQGFFLKFASGALGTDSSGNGNDFTVSGTMTNTTDTPDNNFCTLNSLDNYWQESTFSNGNNTIVTATNGHPYNTSTMGMATGKWYFETKVVASVGASMDVIGITDHIMISNTDELSQDNYSYAYVGDGNVRSNGTSVDSGTTYTTGDIISVAVDLTNSKLYFAKNGTWINSGDPTSGATGTGATSIQAVASTGTGVYQFGVGAWSGSASGTYSTNFGNGYFGTTAISSGNADDAGEGDFEYDVPAGYYALCTNNLGDQS